MQRSSRLTVKAADESNEASKVDVKKLGIIPFETDNETFQDVMAFAGTAPEVRVLRSPGVVEVCSSEQSPCNYKSLPVV